VSKGAVSQWMKRARQGGGPKALKRQPAAPGATPRLSEDQRAKLPELLAQGAEAHGFRGEVWTCERVAISDPKGVWGELSPGACESGGAGAGTLLAKTTAPF
jgi:transposase